MLYQLGKRSWNKLRIVGLINPGSWSLNLLHGKSPFAIPPPLSAGLY